MSTKKVVRTYSRQKRTLYDEEPPTKRRRVENPVKRIEGSMPIVEGETTSSPWRNEIFESSEPPTSSPKNSSGIWSDEVPRSSPPSELGQTSSPPPVPKRRPVFSIFKRTSKPTVPTKQPLSERSHNAQSPPRSITVKKRMVQMQLDLASETRKACKTCGMEYISSNAEDAALHKKFHAMNVGGVDLTKAVSERLRKTQVWSGGDGSFIAVIGRKDALALRSRASDVLKVVNTELAAVPISDEELWGQTTQQRSTVAQECCTGTQAASNLESSNSSVDRFRVYLYVRANKCVGACLAERIWDAYAVLDQNDTSAPIRQLPSEHESSSISIDSRAIPATLGISRIWTSNQHRKQGIATRLLDCVRSNFLYGLQIEKDKVAFSQPTESGGKLAKKWHGRQAGWHVYID